MGDFAGRAVRAAKILMVSEESEEIWASRRNSVGIGDHVRLIARPFLGRPTSNEWEQFIGDLARQIRAEGYEVVIFDSMPNLWPVRDENDAPDVLAALTPLYALTDAGAAVVLVFHPKKGDAAEGQATRGSGASQGFVDIIVELHRTDNQGRKDNRRTLRAYSRYSETPERLVISYDPVRGYTSLGTEGDATVADRLSVLRSQLPGKPPGATAEEIRSNWPEGHEATRPGLRTLRADLEASFAKEEVGRTGRGVKGDAHRYHRIEFDSGKVAPLGGAFAGMESEDEWDEVEVAP